LQVGAPADPRASLERKLADLGGTITWGEPGTKLAGKIVSIALSDTDFSERIGKLPLEEQRALLEQLEAYAGKKGGLLAVSITYTLDTGRAAMASAPAVDAERALRTIRKPGNWERLTGGNPERRMTADDLAWRAAFGGLPPDLAEAARYAA